jgi:Mn-containing catalase
MTQIKQLLIEELQDLLHAETQLIAALPKMAKAAHHPKLKEAFEKHLLQTQEQAERLRTAFDLLGEEPELKPCKAMMGLIAEGEETIKEGEEKDPAASDLGLIAAAQRVEHYEIASYGTARSLARQLGEYDCARLLAHTLGEEEGADFLLTAIAAPLIQQVSIEDMGAEVNLDAAEKDEKRTPGRSAKKKAARPAA